MKAHSITFSLVGYGHIQIKAKTRKEAAELLVDYDMEQLMEYCDFEDSLKIDSMNGKPYDINKIYQ